MKIAGEQTERFRREAKAIAALNHRHICAVFDVGPNYPVMEYVEGEPPRGPYYPRKRSKLPNKSRKRYGRRTSTGLYIAI
jgi:serine/threonine-protein kinase